MSAKSTEAEALSRPIDFEKLANEDLNECLRRLEEEIKLRFGP